MQFIDKRGQLPQHPTRRYGQRDVSKLKATCDHHTASNPAIDDEGNHVTHVRIAEFHSGPDSHLQGGGAPGIAYTYVVEQDATIVECWDLSVRTWAQGWRDREGDENADFVAVNHVGDFHSATSPSGKRPTPEQIHASLSLHLHLTGRTQDPRLPARLFDAVPYGPGKRVSHRELGKPACPGDDVALLSELAQHHDTRIRIVGDKAWQEALIAAGYPMPKYGADGDWGTESRAALVAFQRDTEPQDPNVRVNGQRDLATEAALLRMFDRA